MLDSLFSNLERYAPLTPREREVVEDLTGQRKRFPIGADLIVEDEQPAHCRLLLEGQAFRHKTLPDGRRQIMVFHVPGDALDLQGLFMAMDHSVTALTACEVALAPHAKVLAAFDAFPRLARAFWRMNMLEGAIFRAWMVGMGRRSAYARIAHLFCEMVLLLRAAGLGRGDVYPFPITQQHLSDALGLSAVHTNRVLQQLRGHGLLAFAGGELTVMDWPGLQAAGEFDPAYLHLATA